MTTPERKMLGRLILETPEGHREPLADLWSDQPLNAASLLESVTRHVGGALDHRPSPTDIRSHDPGNPQPVPVKAPQVDRAAQPQTPRVGPEQPRPLADRSHGDNATARDARRESGMLPPPAPTKHRG
jgi:hypothetical protein